MARRDLGVPLHLDDLGARGVTRVLILAEEGADPSERQADFVWYTRALPEKDHCAEWRERRP